MEFAPLANLAKSTNHFCSTREEPLEMLVEPWSSFTGEAERAGWRARGQPSLGKEELLEGEGQPVEC